jgi:hypothetical protein
LRNTWTSIATGLVATLTLLPQISYAAATCANIHYTNGKYKDVTTKPVPFVQNSNAPAQISMGGYGYVYIYSIAGAFAFTALDLEHSWKSPHYVNIWNGASYGNSVTEGQKFNLCWAFAPKYHPGGAKKPKGRGGIVYAKGFLQHLVFTTGDDQIYVLDKDPKRSGEYVLTSQGTLDQ